MAQLIQRLFKREPRKAVLNVGGGNKQIPLPPEFKDYDHILFDIDPSGKPDIVGNALHLGEIGREKFDAIYCSHNLEHFHYHEVPLVLEGMFTVLKPGGFVYIRVPDIVEAIRLMIERGQDLEEGLYIASGVPIMALDVIYGWSREIEQSGQPYYAHKTAFTEKSLRRKLTEVGFVVDKFVAADIEFRVLAHKP